MALSMRSVAACVVALVLVLLCVVESSVGAATPLASSSASSSYQLTTDNEWKASFTFDNTIANSSVWFQFTGIMVQGDPNFGGVVALFYNKVVVIPIIVLVGNENTVSFVWNVPPCADVEVVGPSVISTGNKLGNWTVTLDFSGNSTQSNVIVNGTITIGAQAPLLAQPNTEYSAQMGGNKLYTQVVVPPASKTGFESELSLTITEPNGSLDWLKEVTFSNDATCIFYQFPTINISTPDASTTAAISLPAGTWNIQLYGDVSEQSAFREVELSFAITNETATGPVLEESSNTVAFEVSPTYNYTFSMTFDNTIANSSMWFQYKNDATDLPVDTYMVLSVGMFYTSNSGMVEIITVFAVIYPNKTNSFIWNVAPCSNLYTPGGRVVSTGDHTGTWTLVLNVFDDKNNTQATVQGSMTIGSQNPLLSQSNSTYLANTHGTTQYLRLVAPPVKETGDGTKVTFTISDPSATNGTSSLLSLLNFVIFSNNDTCVFGPLGTYPTFENVSTTAPSTSVTTVLEPGVWNIMISSNNTEQSVLQYSWSVAGEVSLDSDDDDDDEGFWTTEHIIIISVIGGILVIAAVAAIAGTVYFVRRRQGGYESV